MSIVHEGIKDFKCETQHEIIPKTRPQNQITHQTNPDKNITIKNVQEEPKQNEKCLCTICHRFYRNAQVLEIHVTNVHKGIKE